MKVKGRYLWARIGPVIAAMGVAAGGVVVLPGSASAASPNACLRHVPGSGQGVLRGEALTVQNKLASPFTVRFDRLDWHRLAAGQSCTYDTNRPDVAALLCLGTPPVATSKECDPKIKISIDNPGVGKPTISVGSVLDSAIAEGESRTVTTTVGSQRLAFNVTRGDDSPVGGDYKKHWTVAVSPG
jgi:hypothetical protein